MENETPVNNPPSSHFVQIIPGTGFVVAILGEDDHEILFEPLVAWGLNKEGTVVPLGSDPEGFVDTVNSDAASNILGVIPDDKNALKVAEALRDCRSKEEALKMVAGE
jgi:hypothetical protein